LIMTEDSYCLTRRVAGLAVMECLSARTSAFVLAVSFLLVPPSHAEESQSRVPSYIEADRTQAEETLGGALANDVFSDRFTALRKRLIASSLRANPAAGCGAAPAFTLQIVVGVERSPEASAWQEVYVIRCKVDVRRTFLLFLSPKDGMKSVELAPGGTIADATLQRDVLQGASVAAMIGRGTAAGCKRVQVRDTRVTSGTGLSNTPWTEAWTMDACGTSVDVEIKFTPSAQGGTDWSILPYR
jgi:hypothetical protein